MLRDLLPPPYPRGSIRRRPQQRSEVRGIVVHMFITARSNYCIRILVNIAIQKGLYIYIYIYKYMYTGMV